MDSCLHNFFLVVSQVKEIDHPPKSLSTESWRLTRWGILGVSSSFPISVLAKGSPCVDSFSKASSVIG